MIGKFIEKIIHRKIDEHMRHSDLRTIVEGQVILKAKRLVKDELACIVGRNGYSGGFSGLRRIDISQMVDVAIKNEAEKQMDNKAIKRFVEMELRSSIEKGFNSQVSEVAREEIRFLMQESDFIKNLVSEINDYQVTK